MTSDQLINLVHDRVRDAVGDIPELKKISEREYCGIVLEGIESYVAGIEMRAEELDQEAEDEGDDE